MTYQRRGSPLVSHVLVSLFEVATLDRRRDSMGAVFSMELGQDVLHVPFDSIFRDVQLVSYNFVRAAGGNMLKHLDFSLR